MEAKEILPIISKLLSDLSWPIVVLIIIYKFAEPINQFIKHLKKIDIPGVALETWMDPEFQRTFEGIKTGTIQNELQSDFQRDVENISKALEKCLKP